MDDCYFVKLLNVLSFFSKLLSFSPFASYFSHILTVVWRIHYISYLKLVFLFCLHVVLLLYVPMMIFCIIYIE